MTYANPTYCPHCGTSLILAEAAGRQRPTCPACGFVYYHNPLPAAGVVIEMEGGVVLIQRGHPPHAGEWALPSGFIEADESVEEAAVREAAEETGLAITLGEMLGVFSFPDGPPTSGIIVFYRAEPVGGILSGGDDAVDARVFMPDELPELPFRTHRQAIHRWHAQQTALGDEVRLHRNDFFIRQAVPADVPALLALQQQIPGKDAPTPNVERAASQRLQETPGFAAYVAAVYDTPPAVIGFVTLSSVITLHGRLGWIDSMVVDAAHRRIGVGAALLDAVLRHAHRQGMIDLFVNTVNASEVARAFYRSSGFSEGRITRLRLR